MPLTSAQIVTLACQDAQCPGFTSQGGQFLNAALQDYCMLYDLEAALGTYNFSFNSAAGQGSGPYVLPLDYLRTRVQDGKDEFFYTIQGVPYPLIQCTLTEFDWMVQTPGFQNFPYYYATDLSPVTLGQPATLKVWPPASGSYPCTMRYYRQMPDIATPETSATVPWFTNTMILQRDVAGRLMGLTNDSRQADYLGDDDAHPLGVGNLMRKYLRNVEDREGAVHTVGRDRRRWGRSFDLLKNTKTIGWAILFMVCLWCMLPDPVRANCTTPCTKSQITTDINTNWPDNSVGAITPALLRSTVLDLVNSYVDVNGTSSFACSTHQFLTAIATLSSYTCTQPNVADLVQDPTAWSFLGNATNAAAAYSPFTIGALVNKPSPVATDLLVLQDATTGALRNCQISQCIAAVSTGVTSVNGQTGALVQWAPPQGRLTLVSGTPVMATSQAGATTVYYTSYVGKNVPIYNGALVAQYQLCAANTTGACELSVVLGSNWTTNTNYDFFIALDTGPTVRLCTGPSWNSGAGSDTARGTGGGSTDLQQIDGINTNKNLVVCRYNNTTTFNVPINQGTYVGTMRIGAAGQTNFIYGAAAANGTAGSFGLWNAYNRITVRTTVRDTNINWAYTSSTIRPADNSTTNRVSFISGLSEDGFSCSYQNRIELVGVANSFFTIGCALDSTTVFDVKNLVLNGSTSPFHFPIKVANDYAPVLGQHFVQALEAGDSTNANQSAGNTDMAFIFEFEM